jgi:ribosome-associated protein
MSRHDELHPEDDLPLSKSGAKREMLALQQLAERLVEQRFEQIARLELGASLRAALDEYGRVKGRGAQRRHIRRLARLLSQDLEGLASVRALIGEDERQSAQDKARFHRLERWRSRLLEEDDQALGELIGQYPQADIQHLRRLVRTAQRETATDRPPTAARKLFRYLRELDEAAPV